MALTYARRSFQFRPNIVNSMTSIGSHRLFSTAVDAQIGAQFSRKKTRSGISTNKVSNSDGICAAYCVDNPVVLFRAANFFRKSSFTVNRCECNDSKVTFTNQDVKVFDGDVVHIPFREANAKRSSLGHAFLFSSGAVVFWGLPAAMRKRVLDEFGKFQDPAHLSVKPVSRRDDSELLLEMDEFDHEFKYSVENGRKRPSFKNDEILITDFEDVEQLLAFSYGLAQSVKLLLFEEVIDALVLRTRSLPDELARDGKIKLSHRAIKGLIGELLAARYAVNLVSDIKDTPEYFWHHPDLEALHQECAGQVELRQRARILDSRTEVIKEALDILNNELSSTSSDRVERAILALIAVEVCIEIARMTFGTRFSM